MFKQLIPSKIKCRVVETLFKRDYQRIIQVKFYLPGKIGLAV